MPACGSFVVCVRTRQERLVSTVDQWGFQVSDALRVPLFTSPTQIDL